MSFGPFSTLPNGLANLFGLTGQSTPKALDETLQAGLDVMPFLAGANAQEVIGGAPGLVNAVGLFPLSGLIVPPTEAWLVRGIGATWITLVGEALQAKLVVGRVLAAGNICIREIGPTTGSRTAGVSRGQLAMTDPGLILFPSDFLGIAVEAITTAGNISIFQQGLIYRFTV